MNEAVFVLPDLGEGLTSAEVLTWLVGEGDLIEIDQEIVTVETAKASVDVPSPYAGRVVRLHAQVGDTVPVGSDLITVEPPAAAADADAASGVSGAVLIGYGTTELPPRVARKKRRRGSASLGQESGPPAQSSTVAVKVISPLVRRAAAEQGVNLHNVQPSGPHGIIRRADIGAAATEPGARRVTSQPGATATASSADAIRIPLQGVRRAVADKVSRSRSEIPDATAWVDVDATEFMAAAAAMARRRGDRRSGVLPLLARTVVAGLAQFPELNASVDMEAGEIIRHREVNLGIAMQTPRGLVVPVIKDADQMTTDDLAASLEILTEQARNGSLAPDTMVGGTFTLNNYGVFGVDGSTPILNHPEAGMIGVGRIVQRPWAHNAEIALREVGQVSMTFDHRVCDGGSAAGLLRFVADCMEQPAVLLAHV